VTHTNKLEHGDAAWMVTPVVVVADSGARSREGRTAAAALPVKLCPLVVGTVAPPLQSRAPVSAPGEPSARALPGTDGAGMGPTQHAVSVRPFQAQSNRALQPSGNTHQPGHVLPGRAPVEPAASAAQPAFAPHPAGSYGASIQPSVQPVVSAVQPTSSAPLPPSVQPSAPVGQPASYLTALQTALQQRVLYGNKY